MAEKKKTNRKVAGKYRDVYNEIPGWDQPQEHEKGRDLDWDEEMDMDMDDEWGDPFESNILRNLYMDIEAYDGYELALELHSAREEILSGIGVDLPEWNSNGSVEDDRRFILNSLKLLLQKYRDIQSTMSREDQYKFRILENVQVLEDKISEVGQQQVTAKSKLKMTVAQWKRIGRICGYDGTRTASVWNKDADKMRKACSYDTWKKIGKLFYG